jgi:hypothetical protein
VGRHERRAAPSRLAPQCVARRYSNERRATQPARTLGGRAFRAGQGSPRCATQQHALPPSVLRTVSFSEALRFWLKLGFISFGGPAGQIAIMHRELVEEKRWISESRFLHALNYCMLLPGPEAQQLATYIGWLMHRTWGGVVAGRCLCCRRCSS